MVPSSLGGRDEQSHLNPAGDQLAVRTDLAGSSIDLWIMDVDLEWIEEQLRARGDL